MYIDMNIGEATVTLCYSREQTSDVYDVGGCRQVVVGYCYELLGAYTMGAGGRKRIELSDKYRELASEYIETNG